MSKRGLSLEEKRTKVLDILQSSNTCFLLKDIEKLAVKAGVTQQSVKDVIQSLICDDLVSSDKLGTSVYFWSLKSTRANKARVTNDALNKDVTTLTAQVADLQAKVTAARAACPEGAEHAEASAAHTAAKLRHQALTEELTARAGSDPAVAKAVQELPSIGVLAANRWLDNIYMVSDFMTRKGGAQKDQVNAFVKANCGINLSSVDYVTLDALKSSLQPKGSKKAKAPTQGAAKKRKAADVDVDGDED